MATGILLSFSWAAIFSHAVVLMVIDDLGVSLLCVWFCLFFLLSRVKHEQQV